MKQFKIKKNRFIRFLLTFFATFTVGVTAFGFVVSKGFSAAVSGLEDTNIGLNANGNGWTASGTTINGTVTGTAATSSCGSTTPAKSASSSLTITNNTNLPKTLSFNYANNINGGQIVIDGATQTKASDSFSKELQGKESIEISITSAEGAKTTSIQMTDVSLIGDESWDTTFKPGENCTYTVTYNGEDGAETRSVTNDETVFENKKAKYPFTLKAVVPTGFKFSGWRRGDMTPQESGDDFVIAAATYSYSAQESTWLYPVAVPNDVPLFKAGSIGFKTFSSASTYAVTNNYDSVILTSDGTLKSDITVPASVILYIPNDSVVKPAKNTPTLSADYATPSVFRTLNIASGVTVTVNGSIELGSLMSKGGTGTGSHDGAPTGKYGKINLPDVNSKIVLNSGSSLYSWGFIVGAGTVEAKSGSTVWEAFQIKSFRGGTASLGMSSKQVFPFNQYYVQNIESKIIYSSGAKENCYTALAMSGSEQKASCNLIGTSNCLFNMSSGTIERTYNSSTDRTTYSISGNATLGAIKLSLGGASMDSSKYPLPISSNMDIEIVSGSISVNTDIDLLPSAKITVRSGASCTINQGKTVCLYDVDQWDNYACEGAKLSVVDYSPTLNSKPSVRTAASLIDAELDINGTLTVNGYFRTTKGHANIHSSSKTGTIVAGTTANFGNKNTYQVTQSGTSTTQVTIATDPAYLRNGSDKLPGDSNPGFPYTTSVNKTGTYKICDADEYWYVNDKATVSFDANGGDGIMDNDTNHSLHQDFILPSCSFSKTNWSFDGWEIDGARYAVGSKYHLLGNITVKALWVENSKYHIRWVNYDGSLLSEEDVYEGVLPQYIGAEPTRQADDEYIYSFSGWSPIPSAAHQNQTYTAQFSRTEKPSNTYVVTWLNWDGTKLLEETYPENSLPTPPENPSRASDAQYSYVFTGWDKPITIVTADIAYTAVYSSVVNKYTVEWANYDGNILVRESLPYGVLPSYAGTEPQRPADSNASYEFIGWDPEITAVTQNVRYTAQYRIIGLPKLITFINYDGTILQSSEFVYGTNPVYSGEVPTRPANTTNQLKYVFSGWSSDGGITKHSSDDLPLVSGDTTYVAQFESFVSGLREENGILKVFDENGVFNKDADGPYHYNDPDFGDDHWYWVENGVVDSQKGIKSGPGYHGTTGRACYFYVGENGYLITDQRYYVSESGGLDGTFVAGWHIFGYDGMIHDNPKDLPHLDSDGITVRFNDSDNTYPIKYAASVAYGYGLFKNTDGFFYYAKEDGTIFRANGDSEYATLYVEDTRGLLSSVGPLNPGLYCFDRNGHMFMVMDGTNYLWEVK